jgi:hypothetical protein
MELSKETIEHIKALASTIEHGEILIKLNKTRDIVDVSGTNVKRFYKDKEQPSMNKPGGNREG